MAEKFLNMARDINLQIQQAEPTQEVHVRNIIFRPDYKLFVYIAITRISTKKPKQSNIHKTTINISEYNPKNVQETIRNVREMEKKRTRGNKLNTNNSMAYLNSNTPIINLNVNGLST